VRLSFSHESVLAHKLGTSEGKQTRTLINNEPYFVYRTLSVSYILFLTLVCRITRKEEIERAGKAHSAG
jgi:hypothetical protein